MQSSFRTRFATILTGVIIVAWWSVSSDALARGSGSSGGYHAYKGAKAIDGDTFRYGGERYRVQQYNAPELGQPGSRAATRSLQKKIDSGSHEWKPVAKDVYGRSIARERRAD